MSVKESYKKKEQQALTSEMKKIDPNSEEGRELIHKAQKRFEWVVSFMAMTDRFNFEILARLQQVIDFKCQTMGVAPSGLVIQLHYNPSFVNTLKDEELRYALGHEVLHIVFHHITRRAPADRQMAKMDNWAADYAINSLLPDVAGQREYPRYQEDTYSPDGKIIGKKGDPWILLPKQQGFAEQLSREQYLALLEMKFKGTCPRCGKPTRTNEQQEKEEEDKGKDPGQQDQGEQPGQQDQGEQPGEGDGEGQPDPNGKGKGKGEPGCGCGGDHGEGQGGCGDDCCDCGDNPVNSGMIGDHSGWDKDNELADSQIREWVNNMKTESWGSMGFDMVEKIKAAQRSEVKWTTILRHYYGQISTTTKRATYKKPSRRSWYPWTGKVNACMDKKLVCIDTSGSVSSKLLEKFLAETNKLAEVQPVDMITWDVGSTMPKPIPWDRKKLNFSFKGRGGTDPQPCLDLAKKLGYKEAIFLTDGGFDTPTQPAGLRVLWVISADGTTNHLTFGTVIRMKEEVG